MVNEERDSVNNVPYIEELSDGSLEMVVLKSYCRSFRDQLGEIFYSSDVDISYNPVRPMANDVEALGYVNAKKVYEDWFVARAESIVNDGSPAAAAHYAYLLALMDAPEGPTRGRPS